MSDLEDDAFVIAKLLYDNKNIGAKYVPVSQLKEELNLSVEDFDAADFYLLESHYCNGTMGGDSGQRVLTAAGVTFVKTRADGKVPRELQKQMGTQSSTIDVFISHSSEDVRIVTALITLLRSALNIRASHIRCTSVEGYRFDAGIPVDDHLRIELRESKLFLALLTPASIRSTYVLFELGARWGADLPMIPLLAAGAMTASLQGPLKSLNALDCVVSAQVHQLIDQIAKALNLQPESPSVYQECIDELVQNSKSARARQSTRASTRKGATAKEEVRSSTAPSDRSLIIHSAVYGAEDKLNDVTQLISSKASSQSLMIQVSNEALGGDPIHGVVKTLLVVYSYNGELSSKQETEGRELLLP
jgi:hypothetical protein